jgi:hypothetical protein
VLQDPVIPDRPDVRRGFQPRERAVDRMQTMYREAVMQSMFGDGREGKSASDRVSGHAHDEKNIGLPGSQFEAEAKTVLVFIKDLTAKLQQDVKLTTTKEKYLHAAVAVAVEDKLLDIARNPLDPMLAKVVPTDLQLPIDSPAIRPYLKEIEGVVQRKANTVLEDLLGNRPKTPPQRDTAISWLTPPSVSTLPPVGLFKVSPNRSTNVKAAGSPSSPASRDSPYGPSES